MILNWTLGVLAGLSLALLVWQWFAAARFRLHQRVADTSFAPAVTLLKPLKGCDAATEDCLRTWFTQDYAGALQILFAVASAEDPANGVAARLMREYPQRNAQLLVCGPLSGTNAKVSKLSQLENLAQHEILVISDADVSVPRDLLANVVAPLRDSNVGLVNCFYRLANPSTLPMHWEAVAINADFWSQVLQAQMMKPLDFALGAVMATRRQQLQQIGGFAALADCLADDYQLGNRIAQNGNRIVLSPVVVECWDPPMAWAAVWTHQLRWARTIRVCQPMPYFFSILSNPTLWPLLWAAAQPGNLSCAFLALALGLRLAMAADLQHRITRAHRYLPFLWLAPIKDLLQCGTWLAAFMGNTVEWRGQKFTLRRDGTLAKT